VKSSLVATDHVESDLHDSMSRRLAFSELQNASGSIHEVIYLRRAAWCNRVSRQRLPTTSEQWRLQSILDKLLWDCIFWSLYFLTILTMKLQKEDVSRYIFLSNWFIRNQMIWFGNQAQWFISQTQWFINQT